MILAEKEIFQNKKKTNLFRLKSNTFKDEPSCLGNISCFLYKIHVVDGARILKQPWVEMHAIESFLGLPHEIDRSAFYLNQEKGFFCLRRSYDQDPECLGKNKGYPSYPDVSKRTIKMLSDFYQPLNKKLFNLIGEEYDW